MTTPAAASVHCNSPPKPAGGGRLNPASFRVTPADIELFDRRLRDFVPPGAFDAHAHWYDLRAVGEAVPEDEPTVGMATYLREQRRWMGDRAPSDGLFFPMPVANLDTAAANELLVGQLRGHDASRGLAIVRPTDDPAAIERLIATGRIVGLKVYHLFASRRDTPNATCDEYMAEWMWELAQAHGLCLMLHLVRDRALADPENLRYLHAHCRDFPAAKVVLAHAGRGFCGRHTAEGAPQLRGLPNVFFDTSVICEPLAFEAILEVFGPRKLMFGSDFPVSQMRGKAISLGDGFHWLYEHDVPAERREAMAITLVGIESLLALRDACRRQHLRDADVERIFAGNARELLNLAPPAAGP